MTPPLMVGVIFTSGQGCDEADAGLGFYGYVEAHRWCGDRIAAIRGKGELA